MAQLSKRLAHEIRSECGHTLEEILERKSEDDFQQLRSLLTSGTEVDAVQLHNAISVLGRWGKREVIPDIVALIPKFDERGLINVVDALGNLGGAGALREVMKLAQYPSADVRRFVLASLGRIGTKAAREKIAEMEESDESDFVRNRAHRILNQQRK